jgi:hypothetical protein
MSAENLHGGGGPSGDAGGAFPDLNYKMSKKIAQLTKVRLAAAAAAAAADADDAAGAADARAAVNGDALHRPLAYGDDAAAPKSLSNDTGRAESPAIILLAVGGD